jgi:hypothetical protein
VRHPDEALILESQILSLTAPGRHRLKNNRKWFTRTGAPALFGCDENLFSSERDLVALAPIDTDRLNIFLTKYFGYFLKVRCFFLTIKKSV